MRYTIELPLPPREAGKNSHKHWRDNHAEVAPYIQELRFKLRNPKLLERIPKPFATPVTISFEFYLYDYPPSRILDWKTGKMRCRFYLPRDESNGQGAAWPVVDALVREGFLPDDSSKYVHSGSIKLRRTAVEHCFRSVLVVHVDDCVEEGVIK